MKLNRLIGTGAGIIFKGSGFYETDYRSESYSKGKKKAETKKTGAKPEKDATMKTPKTTKSQKETKPTN